jgi:uroporphyrinogen-III synthase
MKRVLVLRPEPGASTTLARARERGLDAVAVTLFDIECVAWEASAASGFDGLLLTSANAVHCAREKLADCRALPVYAVGSATAEAARDAGFDVAATGEAGVDRLLDSIDPRLKLLHLAGRDRKMPDRPRQEITSVTVYCSKARDDVDLQGAQGAVAMIHSPRAGRRFGELVDSARINRNSIAIAAISPEAAADAGEGWACVEAADAPNDDALLALTERLCNKAPAT